MAVKSRKYPECDTCAVRSISFFESVQEREFTELAAHRDCRHYKKNQPVFLEGSFPRGIFCLNSGKVKIFSRGAEGKEQIIHIARAGEVIGFRAMFSGDPYGVSATTLEECAICFLPRDDFQQLLEHNGTLRNEVMKELSRELGERVRLITNMAQKTVRERLAFSLLLLHDIYREDPINLSREDLANLVGTATETLIRLLKEFKEEQLIEVRQRKLGLLDRVALERIAGH